MRPEHYHKQDELWIVEMMERVPSSSKDEVLRKYAAMYKRVHDEHPVPHQKDGKARFSANTALRRYIRRIFPVL